METKQSGHTCPTCGESLVYCWDEVEEIGWFACEREDIAYTYENIACS